VLKSINMLACEGLYSELLDNKKNGIFPYLPAELGGEL